MTTEFFSPEKMVTLAFMAGGIVAGVRWGLNGARGDIKEIKGDVKVLLMQRVPGVEQRLAVVEAKISEATRFNVYDRPS